MTPKTILKKLQDGFQVIYTIRRLRRYTSGDASLVFNPQDAKIGENNIAHKLKCFRLDEKPYNNPRWESSSIGKFYPCCVVGTYFKRIECSKETPKEFPHVDMVYFQYIKGVIIYNHIDPITGNYDDVAYIPVNTVII